MLNYGKFIIKQDTLITWKTQNEKKKTKRPKKSAKQET